MCSEGKPGYYLSESVEDMEYNKNFDDWVKTRTRVYEKTGVKSEDESLKDEKPFKIKINSKQPGAGKTLSIVEYLKDHPDEKTLIIAPSHEFLEELQLSLGRDMKRLIGFERGCKKASNKSKYYNKTKNISPSLFCKNEKCKGWCSYRNQFDQVRNSRFNIIGMPFQFLMHDDIDFANYDNIFIEERVSSPNYCRWNREEMLKEISKLYTNQNKKEIKNGSGHIDLKTLNEVKKCIIDIDFQNFKGLYKKLAGMVSSYNRWVIDNPKMGTEDLCQVNVSELFYSLAFMNDNTYKNGQIEIPWEYILFYKQLMSGKPLEFNCASFIENKFFHYLNEFEEMFPEHVSEIEILETMYKNKNTRIIRRSNSVYKTKSKEAFEQHYRDLTKLIKREKHNKKKKVCILSYKHLVNDEIDQRGLDEKNKIKNIEGFWFGASHGINSYRDYDVLIVFGDLLPGSQHYIEHLLRFYPDEDFPDININTGFDYKIPNDYRMMELYQEFQQDVYDSVHRLRPLSNDVDIYWYGYHIPSKLYDEFEVIE